MIEILANRTYRHLFAAQVIALAGTGLLDRGARPPRLRARRREGGRGPRDRAGDQDDRLCRGRADRRRLRRSAAAPRLPRRHGPGAGGHRVASALRDGGLAGLRPDLPAAIRLCGLHADLPGDDPGRFARGEGLHARALALAPGLRPGEPSEPDARGGIAHGDRLPLAVRRDGDRLPGLGGARPVRSAAAADARRAHRRHLREDDARAAASIWRRRAFADCSRSTSPSRPPEPW